MTQPEESREKTAKTDDVLLKGVQRQERGAGGREPRADDQEMQRQAEQAAEDQQRMG
jgi:hypothetical protein